MIDEQTDIFIDAMVRTNEVFTRYWGFTIDGIEQAANRRGQRTFQNPISDNLLITGFYATQDAVNVEGSKTESTLLMITNDSRNIQIVTDRLRPEVNSWLRVVDEMQPGTETKNFFPAVYNVNHILSPGETLTVKWFYDYTSAMPPAPTRFNFCLHGLRFPLHNEAI